ncbi:hypothetical protein Raf01_81110 [Rugosimonospora africana]|uniref:Uncharacterized protein n=1 Tax=Rugosimonospora africana TaxID=556532 RepID=A0A8J3QZ38_9ACTN|nr:hypothetical protein Raf01_81110 [Rugosimonospora africana]
MECDGDAVAGAAPSAVAANAKPAIPVMRAVVPITSPVGFYLSDAWFASGTRGVLPPGARPRRPLRGP